MSLSIDNIHSAVSVAKNATKGLQRSLKKIRFDDNNIKNKTDLILGYKATDIYGNFKEVFESDNNKISSTRINCADGRKYILSKEYFYSRDLKGREYSIYKHPHNEIKKTVDIKNKDGSGYGYALFKNGKIYTEWKTNPDGSGNIKEYFPNGKIRSKGILSHFNVEISHKDYTSEGKEIIY